MNRLSDIESVIDRLHTALSGGRGDLSAKQIRAFLMLAKASLEDDPLTTEDLRRYLNLSSHVAHKTIEHLVKRNLIEKRVCTFDTRARHLYLTEEGKKVASAFMNTPSVAASREAAA